MFIPWGAMRRVPRVAVDVDECPIAPGRYRRVRFITQGANQQFKAFPTPPIIRIQKDQILPLADPNAVVAGRAGALILLVIVLQARIAGGIDGRARVVGGAVVDDNVLPIGQGLRLDGGNGAADGGGGVIGGGDDADCWHGNYFSNDRTRIDHTPRLAA